MGLAESTIPPLQYPIDLKRYSGVWYEIARSKNVWFERGACNVRAIYTLNNDGGIDIRNEAVIKDAHAFGVNGPLPIWWETSANKVRNGQFLLEMTTDTIHRGDTQKPLFGDIPIERGGEYNIVDLDFENYSWAIVSSGPQTGWVWILSRTPTMKNKLFKQLADRLETEFGFDPRQLERTCNAFENESVQPKQMIVEKPEHEGLQLLLY